MEKEGKNGRDRRSAWGKLLGSQGVGFFGRKDGAGDMEGPGGGGKGVGILGDEGEGIVMHGDANAGMENF